MEVHLARARLSVLRPLLMTLRCGATRSLRLGMPGRIATLGLQEQAVEALGFGQQPFGTRIDGELRGHGSTPRCTSAR